MRVFLSYRSKDTKNEAKQIRGYLEKRPAGHDFTTGVARLSAIPESAVYVAAGNYALTGRGWRFVEAKNPSSVASATVIKTKILPASAGGFQFKACFAANLGAEDELDAPAEGMPVWFEALRNCTIDVSSLKVEVLESTGH